MPWVVGIDDTGYGPLVQVPLRRGGIEANGTNLFYTRWNLSRPRACEVPSCPNSSS